ncbi:hypothetical protein [Sporosarcina sp. P20a]|uniref:hypothetical protein n=1 Tax=Sporosarcina sp. P20a TaxID=2048256 RepID=UPI001304358C|nr:hypothetical protein [Sporosarcina sp. P20a]
MTIQQHQMELMKDELKEVVTQYNELQQRDKRRFIPKWHALHNGPRSINQLAKVVADENDGDQDLLARVYSVLSVDAHNYMELNSNGTMDDFFTIKPVKSIYNQNEDEYNFAETRALLTRAIMKYTKRINPEYEDRLQEFAIYISPYLPK